MTTQTTNRIQESYMLAKANLEALEESKLELEQKYIADHGIKNADGSTPECLWRIEDDETFKTANAVVGKMLEDNGLWAEILEATDLLKAAEDRLIRYGLSLAPVREREILTNAVKTNYTTRLKVLDLALRLDVSTVLAR